MIKYEIFFTKQAVRDLKSLTPQLRLKLKTILSEVISNNPFLGKKLMGDLEGNHSYRLNIRDRMVYSVDKKKKHIYIKRARTHYGR